jgi:hypothetical protein
VDINKESETKIQSTSNTVSPEKASTASPVKSIQPSEKYYDLIEMI